MAKKPTLKQKIANKLPVKPKPPPEYVEVSVYRFKIDDLEDAPYNARKITQDALAGLAASLEEFGLLALPVVNMRPKGPRIVSGHQRVRNLREQGMTHVDCVVVQFDDATEKRANFALNNRAIQGTFIPELTRALLEQIEGHIGNGDSSLFARLNFDALVQQITKRLQSGGPETKAVSCGYVDEDALPTLLKKTKAVSKTGHFYQLGNHVVSCGELKSASGFLFGFPKNRADMAFTEFSESAPLDEAFLDVHLNQILGVTNGAIYIAVNIGRLGQVQERFVQLGGHWSNTLLWVDQDHKVEYPYEGVVAPVLYGWREGNKHQFYGETVTSNVSNFKRPPKARIPVEIVTRAMSLSSKPGDVVLDTRIYDGTTIIAAEQIGRRLFGYAETPARCDLVRKRWAEYVYGKACDWKGMTPKLKD